MGINYCFQVYLFRLICSNMMLTHKHKMYRVLCCIKSLSLVWLFCNPMDCSPPGSVHGILQARILEWVAMPSSRRSSQPRDRTNECQIFPLQANGLLSIWQIKMGIILFIICVPFWLVLEKMFLLLARRKLFVIFNKSRLKPHVSFIGYTHDEKLFSKYFPNKKSWNFCWKINWYTALTEACFFYY